MSNRAPQFFPRRAPGGGGDMNGIITSSQPCSEDGLLEGPLGLYSGRVWRDRGGEGAKPRSDVRRRAQVTFTRSFSQASGGTGGRRGWDRASVRGRDSARGSGRDLAGVGDGEHRTRQAGGRWAKSGGRCEGETRTSCLVESEDGDLWRPTGGLAREALFRTRRPGRRLYGRL